MLDEELGEEIVMMAIILFENHWLLHPKWYHLDYVVEAHRLDWLRSGTSP